MTMTGPLRLRAVRASALAVAEASRVEGSACVYAQCTHSVRTVRTLYTCTHSVRTVCTHSEYAQRTLRTVRTLYTCTHSVRTMCTHSVCTHNVYARCTHSARAVHAQRVHCTRVRTAYARCVRAACTHSVRTVRTLFTCTRSVRTVCTHSVYAQCTHSVRSVRTMCTRSVYAQCTRSVRTVRTLYTCTHNVRTMRTHSVYVRTPYTCTHGVRTACTRSVCTHSVYAQCTHSVRTMRTLYTCTHSVRTVCTHNAQCTHSVRTVRTLYTCTRSVRTVCTHSVYAQRVRAMRTLYAWTHNVRTMRTRNVYAHRTHNVRTTVRAMRTLYTCTRNVRAMCTHNHNGEPSWRWGSRAATSDSRGRFPTATRSTKHAGRPIRNSDAWADGEGCRASRAVRSPARGQRHRRGAPIPAGRHPGSGATFLEPRRAASERDNKLGGMVLWRSLLQSEPETYPGTQMEQKTRTVTYTDVASEHAAFRETLSWLRRRRVVHAEGAHWPSEGREAVGALAEGMLQPCDYCGPSGCETFRRLQAGEFSRQGGRRAMAPESRGGPLGRSLHCRGVCSATRLLLKVAARLGAPCCASAVVRSMRLCPLRGPGGPRANLYWVRERVGPEFLRPAAAIACSRR